MTHTRRIPLILFSGLMFIIAVVIFLAYLFGPNFLGYILGFAIVCGPLMVVYRGIWCAYHNKSFEYEEWTEVFPFLKYFQSEYYKNEDR